MSFTIVFVVALCIASIRCDDDCVSRTCPQLPKHYEELGCKEIKDNDDCCATSFDCPDFANYDSSKCHLKGKLYNVSDTLGDNDMPPFLAACRCSVVDDQPAAFECATVECPEDLGGDYCADDCTPVQENVSCISVYENMTSACHAKEICDENEMAKLATCHDNDKVYHSGERFEPQSQSCYECLCTDDYDNTTVAADNVNCVKVDCGIEIREANKIRSGCVPIYYGRERCCPIDYRCPSDDDQLMDQLKTSDTKDESVAATCTFGNLTLRVDQQLQLVDKCTECKCAIPPMITCTQLTDCSESK